MIRLPNSSAVYQAAETALCRRRPLRVVGSGFCRPPLEAAQLSFAGSALVADIVEA